MIIKTLHTNKCFLRQFSGSHWLTASIKEWHALHAAWEVAHVVLYAWLKMIVRIRANAGASLRRMKLEILVLQVSLRVEAGLGICRHIRFKNTFGVNWFANSARMFRLIVAQNWVLPRFRFCWWTLSKCSQDISFLSVIFDQASLGSQGWNGRLAMPASVVES